MMVLATCSSKSCDSFPTWRSCRCACTCSMGVCSMICSQQAGEERASSNENILPLQYGHKCCEDRTTTQHFCLQHCSAKAITPGPTNTHPCCNWECSGTHNYHICSLTSRHAFALLVKAIITRNAKQEQIIISWSAKIGATCRYGLLSKACLRLTDCGFCLQVQLCTCASFCNQDCRGPSRSADSGQHQHKALAVGNMCGIMQLPSLLS